MNESNVPIPDPTIATNEAVERAVSAERDYVDGQIGILEERLDAIDKATKLLNETVNRVPTALQEGLSNLAAIVDERFKSVSLQFTERDTRSERETRDNQIRVDAAFAAQKEAAAEQNKSNTLAIDKSEKATAEQIKGQGEKVDDLKERLGAVESRAVGNTEAVGQQRADRTDRLNTNGLYIAAAAVIVTLGGIITAIILSKP